MTPQLFLSFIAAKGKYGLNFALSYQDIGQCLRLIDRLAQLETCILSDNR